MMMTIADGCWPVELTTSDDWPYGTMKRGVGVEGVGEGRGGMHCMDWLAGNSTVQLLGIPDPQLISWRDTNNVIR